MTIHLTTAARCHPWLAAIGLHVLLIGLGALWYAQSLEDPIGAPRRPRRPPPEPPAVATVSMADPALLTALQERASRPQPVGADQPRDAAPTPSAPPATTSDSPAAAAAPPPAPVGNPVAAPAHGRGAGVGGGVAGDAGAIDWSGLSSWDRLVGLVGEQPGWSLLVQQTDGSAKVVVRGADAGQWRDITADVRPLLPRGFSRALVRLPQGRAADISSSRRIWIWRERQGRWELE